MKTSDARLEGKKFQCHEKGKFPREDWMNTNQGCFRHKRNFALEQRGGQEVDYLSSTFVIF